MSKMAWLQKRLREAEQSGDDLNAALVKGEISNLKEQQAKHSYMMNLPPSGPAKDWEVFESEEAEVFMSRAKMIASESGRVSGPRYKEVYSDGKRELVVVRDQGLNNQMIEFAFRATQRG